MSNLLFLFSAGQDSIFYFYFVLCQRQSIKLTLFTINHYEQLNSHFLIFYTLRFGTVFRQKLLLSNLTSPVESQKVLNENFFRFARYSFAKRLNDFYQNQFLLTGHTNSDLMESKVLNFWKTFDINEGLNQNRVEEFFKKKELLKKQYFKFLNSYSPLKTTFSKKKTKKQFRLTFSFSQKTLVTLNRPLQSLNRTEILTIGKARTLPYFIELTNFSNLIVRNKIRLYFLPFFYFSKLNK